MSGYAKIAEMAMQNPQLVQAGLQAMGGMGGATGGMGGATGGMGGAMGGMGGATGGMGMQDLANMYFQGRNSGMKMSDIASTAAMAMGHPEVSMGIDAVKWYGKWNGIYTIVICVIILILCWWIFVGMLCGSHISLMNGWTMSAGWSGS